MKLFSSIIYNNKNKWEKKSIRSKTKWTINNQRIKLLKFIEVKEKKPNENFSVAIGWSKLLRQVRKEIISKIIFL